MQLYELNCLLQERKALGKLYLEFARLPTLSVGLYVLGVGVADPQQPHAEDEVYYIIGGTAKMRVGDEDRDVTAGSTIVVPARAPHRFHSITEELTVLVFFAPAEGTNPQ
jgi:mannose-6-phosphate isomerase-like protein (cupin superfamily)